MDDSFIVGSIEDALVFWETVETYGPDIVYIVNPFCNLTKFCFSYRFDKRIGANICSEDLNALIRKVKPTDSQNCLFEVSKSYTLDLSLTI